ncbi:MAG TPA: D-Ala-D-Ala carboxypeptidase family metallohydrolase [Nevskia sp.]|nr:D-Ala-D-Ala carboxypeptidase family metallohydrolase [Nevskia sp.]
MTPIGRHFTLEELLRSQLGERLGIDNTPPPSVLSEMRRLVELVLDPLREQLGQPLHVDSGYRCPRLNQAVGGAPHSQHVLGQAADLVCPGMDPYDLCQFVAGSSLPFDQLIYEGSWTHVSIAAAGVAPRGSSLTAIFQPGAATRYVPGIVRK